MRICFLFFILFNLTIMNACGVKGRPMPPLTNPPIGRGEPNFSKATEKVKLKKTPIKDDFEEPLDFQDDREK